MTPPSKKVEEQPASELWLALTTLPRPHRVVPMPRNIPGTSEPIGELAMWPLSQEEHHIATARAEEYVKKLLKDPQKKDEANIGYQNLFASEVAVQQLCLSCRDAGNLDRPAFPSAKDMRLKLTTDEIGVLYNNYLTVQSELGPIVAHMSEDEYEAIVKRLAEGGSAFPFDSLSWDMRNHLVITMASQLVDYWMATASHGPQQGESTSSGSIPSEKDAPESDS